MRVMSKYSLSSMFITKKKSYVTTTFNETVVLQKSQEFCELSLLQQFKLYFKKTPTTISYSTLSHQKERETYS